MLGSRVFGSISPHPVTAQGGVAEMMDLTQYNLSPPVGFTSFDTSACASRA